MKKIINLLSFLVIINLLVLANLLLIKYNTNINIIPVSYAKTFIHNNDNYNLIVNILKDANKNNFIKYAEYINLNFVPNIPNAPDNKVAFTLSLPQQVSFIAFYDKINNGEYEFSFIIDKLASIDKFYFYDDFLIIEQSDISASTKFNERRFLEIYSNINNEHLPVFSKDIYISKTIKDEENNNTLQEIENSSIDFLDGDLPRILCITTKTLSKEKLSLLNDSKEYTEIDKKIIKEIYQWNPKNNFFEIVEIDNAKKELN